MGSVDSGKTPGNLKKGVVCLSLAFILLIPPFLNFMESLNFSQNAISENARIDGYIPEIMGKAGGRREIKDFYIISYAGIEKKMQLGSRMVTSKEKVNSPEEGAPFKAGDNLPIIYFSKNPQIMILKKGNNLLFSIYHSHRNIALFYLLKLISILLLLYSIKLIFKSLLHK